jgi:undecaprenyl diphosphate synthase
MDAFVSPREPRHLPLHVAIIMDGNGRWASARNLKRSAGHRQGAEAVKRAIEAACRCGIAYLTLFSFSSENWKRPEAEVGDLMSLLRFYLSNEVDFLHRHRVRFRAIGDRERLSRDIVGLIERTEAATAEHRGLTLVVALSYGSRAEITRAARNLALDVAAGRLKAEQIDEDAVSRRLYTDGIPDPDLIIRTSGEQRISNFLLWQAAYAELVFIDRLWPDFCAEDFEEALKEFERRERRFGTAGS